jgi:hypothetical protein
MKDIQAQKNLLNENIIFLSVSDNDISFNLIEIRK